MFKNIHINLINAMVLDGLLADRTHVVIYDNRFEAPIRNECPVCEAVASVCVEFNLYGFSSAIVCDAETGEVLASVCVEFNLYGFSSAIVCDAETGEVLAELKQVNEEWEED